MVYLLPIPRQFQLITFIKKDNLAHLSHKYLGMRRPITSIHPYTVPFQNYVHIIIPRNQFSLHRLVFYRELQFIPKKELKRYVCLENKTLISVDNSTSYKTDPSSIGTRLDIHRIYHYGSLHNLQPPTKYKPPTYHCLPKNTSIHTPDE